MNHARHSRLVEYFITVGIDFDSVAPINDDSISNPIRSLAIISEKEAIPDGFDIIRFTVTGRDASLTKRGMLNKNTKHYLCYSREGTAPLFTRISYQKAKNVNTKEWTRVPGKIMSGKTEHCLCTKNDGLPPIADICVMSVDGKETCPEGFIKLPMAINGLAICFRHLPMDALGLRYQTCIVDRYPRTDHANSPLSNTVAVFCQPNGADIRHAGKAKLPLPTFLSFVLTDSEGRKMYAITVTFYDRLQPDEEQQCLRSLDSIYSDEWRPTWPETQPNELHHSKSVCILSYYPFLLSFREVLKEIYRLANSPGHVPLERFIVNLCCETPLPIPLPPPDGRSVLLKFAFHPITFHLPGEHELPLLDSDVRKIFCCLSLNNTLLLFRAILTQKYKLLFTSAHTSLMTEICEGLTSFLAPFEWQFTYVPVLPYSVLGILDAPVPVLVGMHASRVRPDFFSDPEKQLIVVELDKNSIHIPGDVKEGLIEVPSCALKPLKAELKRFARANKVELFDKNSMQFVDGAFLKEDVDNDTAEAFDGLATRAAFYRFWARLLGKDYREFLTFPDEDDENFAMDLSHIFRIDEFIASRPSKMRKFWRSFSETQAFQKFVEDLTYETGQDRETALAAFHNAAVHLHTNGALANESTSQSSSMATQLEKRMSHTSQSGGATDPFAEFLQETRPQLTAFQVLPPNEDGLAADYKFAAPTAFPTLDDNLLTAPRVTDLTALVEKEKAAEEKSSEKARSRGKSKTIPLKKPSKKRLIDAEDDGPRMGRQRSLHKHQTPLDRAKLQLLQVYGTWFAAHVAALDFKDIPGDEVSSVVKATLRVLYRMTDEHTSRDVLIVPDELIYKACLVLCGKLGQKKQAAALFKDLKRNGIQPSQKTYGAYTNAMASSGANMLLSAAGSTSSGASLASRTHRRSFAPTADGLNVSKIRSLSAAMQNPATSRLNSKKISTIREEHEADAIRQMDLPPTTPYSADGDGDEMKSADYAPPLSSVKSVGVTLSGTVTSTQSTEESDNLLSGDLDITASGAPGRLLSAKSTPVTATLTVTNSDELPSESITPTVWKQASFEKSGDDIEMDGDDDEAKEPAQPSMEAQAQTSSDGKPAKLRKANMNGRVAHIIDYASVEMEARHVCACGYVLCDAQMMVGWCAEFNPSGHVRCIMCRQNAFAPQLRLRYSVTQMSMADGICSFETVQKQIAYLSPLQLRSKVNYILTHTRLDFEDPEMLRAAHEEEFWNMIWYFTHRSLDLAFLLGEADAQSLRIRPFPFGDYGDDEVKMDAEKESEAKSETDENNSSAEKVLEPSSDEVLLAKLRPIYMKATSAQMAKAISEWLLNRSQTPVEKREMSVWNLGVFESFHDLGVPKKFASYEAFVSEFKDACKNIRPKMRDRAWDEPSLAIQACFKHPRLGCQRLRALTPQLSGKPAVPAVPVPVPPAKDSIASDE